MRGQTKQNHFGAQPHAGSAKARAGNGPSSAPPRPERGDAPPHAPGRHFSSCNWEQERSARLRRMFHCIQRGHESGKRVHEQLVWFTWRWNGKAYHSDPSRSFRFSYATLSRLFYAWRKCGESALALGYRAPVKIRQGQTVGFAQACLRPEVRSFIDAHARLPRPRATFYAYRLNLPPDLRRS